MLGIERVGHIVLRVSAEADGLQAVQNAKSFARALRTVSVHQVAGSDSGVPYLVL